MLKRIVPVLLLIVVLFISCDSSMSETKHGKGSLTIKMSEQTKTIEPDYEDITCVSYKVYLNFQDGQQVTADSLVVASDTSTVKIPDLIAGKWDVVVEGYNSDGGLIAKSEEQTVTITQGKDSEATFRLNYFTDGTGKLTISLMVPASVPDVDKVKIELMPIGSSEPIAFTIPKSDALLVGTNYVYSYTEALKAQEYFEVPTGFYDVTITLLSKENVTIGVPYIDSLHIYKDATSPFTLTWDKDFLPRVAAPTFSLTSGQKNPSGTYSSDTKVAISSSSSTAAIYYTLDGSTPSKLSTLYSSPITVDKNTTIRAIGISEGLHDSVVTSENFYVQVSAPQLSISDGIYKKSQKFEVSCNTEGATIYYTTDLSTPTTQSTKYTEALTVSKNTSYRFIAIKDNLENSEVVSAIFVIDNQIVETEVLNPLYYSLAVKYSDDFSEDSHNLSIDESGVITAKIFETNTETNDAAVDYEGSVDYQWYVDGALIPQQITATFKIGSGDEEYLFSNDGLHQIVLKVILTDRTLTEHLSVNILPKSELLDFSDCSWDVISSVVSEGKASTNWSVGDKKEVLLNGEIGGITYSDTSVYAVILDIEEDGHIVLGLVEDAEGNNITLGNYSVSSYSVTASGSEGGVASWTGVFVSPSYGWKDAKKTESVNALKSVLPAELVAVVCPTEKYSVTGTYGINIRYYGGYYASSNTGTTTLTKSEETFWPASGVELFGTGVTSSYDRQYEYFKNSTKTSSRQRLLANGTTTNGNVLTRDFSCDVTYDSNYVKYYSKVYYQTTGGTKTNAKDVSGGLVWLFRI